jgi:hypothetical protein
MESVSFIGAVLLSLSKRGNYLDGGKNYSIPPVKTFCKSEQFCTDAIDG